MNVFCETTHKQAHAREATRLACGIGENHSLMPDEKHGYKSWGEYGKVFSSPLYAQYKNNGMVSRVGYSFTAVQDWIQNGMHQWHFFPAGNQNYYLNYSQFKSSLNQYSGPINTMYER